MRTATYKLATTSALVEYCVDHRPAQAVDELEVPIPELARRVMVLYWRQLAPFEGLQLRQSTQARSRILDAIEAVRNLMPHADLDSPTAAVQLAPLAYKRAVDNISLCLAQQPLARLQHLPGPGRSHTFMFDDFFLHDSVTASELNRHNYAIRLRPAVADGLATLEPRLSRMLRAMWVDDLLRLNQLSGSKRDLLARHLFAEPAVNPSRPTDARSAAHEIALSGKDAGPTTDSGPTSPTFAARLNYLFEKIRHVDGEAYTSGEVATGIRHAGVSLTGTAVSQLRLSAGEAPSDQIANALAKFFGVPPTYFADGETSARTRSATDSPQITGKSVDRAMFSFDNQSAISAPMATTHRLVLDEIDDIASLCGIRPDGCWLAPADDAVLCRPRNTSGTPADAVKMPLHHWAWMVDHGLTAHPMPSDLVRVLRSCGRDNCCNPQHLFVATHQGSELTPRDVAIVINSLYRDGGQPSPELSQSGSKPATLVNPPAPGADSARETATTVPPPEGLPLQDNLESIAAYCTIDRAGCWVIPKTASVPCRATGDDRPASELPKIAPHRWAWMVSNGRASNPLPSDLFQVWKNCGNRRCCNPEHLYLTNPDGEESSAEDADEWMRAEIQQAEAVVATQSEANNSQLPSQVGRHRAQPRIDDEGDERGSTLIAPRVGDAAATGISLADRLNELFENHLQSDGARYSSADVASVLQEDGLAVSADSIDRIRRGACGVASNKTVDALAYFFNVDLDYFSAATPPAYVKVAQPANATPRQDAESSTPHRPPVLTRTRVQVISISVAELGHTVTGLSEAVSECLARDPLALDQAGRLALVLNEVGTLLTLPPGRNSIGRPLLRRIVKEWSEVGHVSHARQSILPKLTKLLNEE